MISIPSFRGTGSTVHYRLVLITALLLATLWIKSPAFSQPDKSPDRGGPQGLTLVNAAMCKGIKDFSAVAPAIVFSIDIGRISCFTYFDPVPREIYIYHKWYNRDKLSTTQRLLLKPPRWSTFSSIQLREEDKGPWRVEVTDGNGNILRTLRFSITD